MKRLTIATAALLLSTFGIFAQNQGGISAEMLSEIRKGYEGNASDKAIRNAMNTTAINILAENAENAAMIDTHFSDKVTTKGISNQKSSGRCWLFTGLNVMRARTIERHDLGEFQFSQSFVFFYDQLEKANLFLQGVIDTRDLPFEDRKVDWLFKNPIGDGGQFTGISNLVTKYGLVPAEAMPESFIANSTAQFSAQLKNVLRQDGLKLRETPEGVKPRKINSYLQEQKTAMLSEIYRMLCLAYGEPPLEFSWKRYNSKGDFVSEKTYTPASFYQEFVGEDLENNYVMVMNDPTREYNKVYEIDFDRHVYDGQNWLYVNLPVDRIKEMAIASIKDNTAMYFSCDVAKFLSRTKGVLDLNNYDYSSLLGVEITMDKKQRVMTHASGSSHAMTLIAVDLKNGVPQKWMVENSWGSASGYKGFLIMTDEWFNEYMFRLVVEKKYVPADILKMLKQKPELLPAWDPMFMPEE